MAASSNFALEKTAVVLIDPYNDFLHPEGKLFPAVQESLTATDTVAHLKTLVAAARSRRVPIFYALHQHWREGIFDGWRHVNPAAAAATGIFQEGGWGWRFSMGCSRT
ncbi:isochorismatase hydrolase [Colletotrichum higginsianum]|nr:isochorismatase hydrolase [Colletotrichum higginsianum]